MDRQRRLFRVERFASEIPRPAVKLKLPFPPSVNNYWRSVVIGRHAQYYVAAEGKRFRQAVAEIVDRAGVWDRMTCRLAVELRATMPNRIRRDLDNLCKATLDALQKAGVYEDDSQIDRLVITWAGIAKPGSIEVRISRLT